MKLIIEQAKVRDCKKVIQEAIDILQPDTCIDFLTDYLRNGKQIEDEFERAFYNTLKRCLIDMNIEYTLAINEGMDFKELYKDTLIEGCSTLNYYSTSDHIEELQYFNANTFYPILKQYMQRALDEVIEKEVRTQKEEEVKNLNTTIEANYRRIANYEKNIEELEKEIIDYEERLKKLLENQ